MHPSVKINVFFMLINFSGHIVNEFFNE